MDKELPFWIIFRDVWEGSSSLAKAALKKVAFERQLADGLEHLVILFLQVFLLSLSCLVLRICAERAMGMLQEILLPFSDHIGIQAVLGANDVELFVALQDGQDSLRFEFSRVLFSWHDSNLRFHYYYYIMHS